jgi:hypothetical protein
MTHQRASQGVVPAAEFHAGVSGPCHARNDTLLDHGAFELSEPSAAILQA